MNPPARWWPTAREMGCVDSERRKLMGVHLTREDDGGVIVRSRGPLAGRGIERVNAQIYGSCDDIRAIRYKVYDFSEVVACDDINMEFLAAQDKAALKINPQMAIVLIAQADLLFGLGRMWEALIDTATADTMVVRNVEAARQWIARRLKRSPNF